MCISVTTVLLPKGTTSLTIDSRLGALKVLKEQLANAAPFNIFKLGNTKSSLAKLPVLKAPFPLVACPIIFSILAKSEPCKRFAVVKLKA